ncbi:MAG: DUF188 domain-containing protein [Treponema sp.]|nr:DUF188 domain-containing protein [Treponema sp.]
MRIFVDADSCPRLTRSAVLRASARTGIQAVFVANRLIPGIIGPTTLMELCPSGEGMADDRIVALARAGDLVITRDIPLAQRLVEASVMVIDDRGREYTPENIQERLSLRDFMVGLAENGLGKDRVAQYGKRELKAFADSFNQILARTLNPSVRYI